MPLLYTSVGKVLLKQVGSFIRFSKSLDSVNFLDDDFQGSYYSHPLVVHYYIFHCRKSVTSEINISDLKDGVLCKPKMTHFLFVNASSRGSVSISVRKLYVLTILQFKSWLM